MLHQPQDRNQMNPINPFQKLYSDSHSLEITEKPSIEISMKDLECIKRNLTVVEFKELECFKKMMDDMPALGMCLIYATRSLNQELTEFLIKELRRLDIDSVPKLCFVALGGVIFSRNAVLEHYSQCNGSLTIIESLLKAGADANIELDCTSKEFGPSFLRSALRTSDMELTKLLLKYGAQKFYLLDRNEKKLIKQTFSESENKIYNEAKKQLKAEQMQLICDNTFYYFDMLREYQNETLTLNRFPNEVVAKIAEDIWNLSRRVSSNQELIDEAKKWIEAQKAAIENHGNALVASEAI